MLFNTVHYTARHAHTAATAATGWLVSPTRHFVLLFITDPQSQMNFLDVITQLWYCTIEGIPTRLKNTRKMNLESATGNLDGTHNEWMGNG